VVDTATRDRKVIATRARIAEAALELFVSQGYAETTIDQIAAAAAVGRRTVFRYFATKEAMLLDHLVVQRRAMLQRLDERPALEPPLVSMHAVLRERCEEGYDRRVLAQIRAVLATEPPLAGEQVWGGLRAFEKQAIATLQRRLGEQASPLEIHALTFMATGWFVTATHMYFTERRPSLVECFDEVVAICRDASTRDLGRSRGRPGRSSAG